MNKEHFDRERPYQAAVAVARTMLRKGLLTPEEFTIFDTKMREKFRPLLGSLYPLETPKIVDFMGV